jgi:hypothetical protein
MIKITVLALFLILAGMQIEASPMTQFTECLSANGLTADSNQSTLTQAQKNRYQWCHQHAFGTGIPG